ncbi:MAG: helix-turn-helix transcriptional regulator [Clostridiales bacterium]|jgi:AraC-like DNA-binding protein|nr:helix-turn-helix transcriptional regulator [Clostridiales bacterium]
MYEWHKTVQKIVDRIDLCIENRDSSGLVLSTIAKENNYSEFYMTRKFKELSGVSFREYLQKRRLAFALIDVRDSAKGILDIALDYGFSSHEAFCRSFKSMYGVPPSTYRAKPGPVVLRTKLVTFDRYFLGLGEVGMLKSSKEVKVYFVSIPAHKFLYIKNYESNGYFDFWEKQDKIPGMDCDTICGMLDSIKGKLDGEDGVVGKYSGQIMGHIYESGGKTAEAYGVRLPMDYSFETPKNMDILIVPESQYIVFEHGSFDYEQESETVGDKLKLAMDNFDYSASDYLPDNSPGRVSYFYFDPEKYEKRVMPVKRK